MKNFVQPGKTVTITAPSGGVISGGGVLVGSLFGVAASTAAAGASVEIVIEGVFDLAKAAGAVGQGDPIYWDAANSLATTAANAGANKLIGVATEAAQSADATARVRLNGTDVR